MILVSEEVSYLPNLDIREDNILEDTLRVARYYRGLADIAAILILGAQRLEAEETVTKRVMGLFPRTRKVKVDMKSRIAEAMLNVEMQELSNAVGQMLSMLQTEHFFALATFLTNINLTKPTKVAKTTASGR